MTFTHALASNNYGPAKFIVATSAANGTHTTLASAISSASAGDTIFLRDSVTENVTLTPGVNIAAYISGAANTPSITGKITMTGAGTSTIYGIRLITNSDFAVSITGSAASILYLTNCYLSGSNNTVIQMTTSSSSALLVLETCIGDLTTTGIAYFSFNSPGTIRVLNGDFFNSGGSTTANSFAGSGGFFPESCNFTNPFSFTGTTVISGQQVAFVCASLNTTAMTFNSTSGSGSTVIYSYFSSGTASALSIGAGSTFVTAFTEIQSSNTNAITGSGTLNYGLIVYSGSSSGNNVTTQTALTTQPVISSPAMTLIATKTASSSASIAFTSGISATYNTYCLIFDNVTAGTNQASLTIQVSSNGGVSYIATGYNSTSFAGNSGAGTVGSNSTTAFILSPTAGVNAYGTGGLGFGTVYLCNMTSGGQPSMHGTSNNPASNASNNPLVNMLAGYGPTATTVNAIQIIFSSGNIATGTFSLYGIKS